MCVGGKEIKVPSTSQMIDLFFWVSLVKDSRVVPRRSYT